MHGATPGHRIWAEAVAACVLQRFWADSTRLTFCDTAARCHYWGWLIRCLKDDNPYVNTAKIKAFDCDVVSSYAVKQVHFIAPPKSGALSPSLRSFSAEHFLILFLDIITWSSNWRRAAITRWRIFILSMMCLRDLTSSECCFDSHYYTQSA